MSDLLKRLDRAESSRAGLLAWMSVLSIASAAWTLPANATIISKGPANGTEVYGYYGPDPDHSFGYGHWAEAIGANPPFGTSEMDVQRAGADLVIKITTPFSLNLGDAPAQAADIAISTHANGIYDLGIALGHQAEARGLYSVTQWQTSRDLWTAQTSYIYGGEWTNDQSCRGSTDPDCGNAAYTPTRIFAGTELANGVTVSQIGNLVTIDVENLALNQFSILWGTADCGNDPIAGVVDVPEPSSLGLLCIGLVGAGFAARRQRVSAAAA
jgi:hypothetical protein